MQFGIRVGQQFKEFVNKGWDIDDVPQQGDLQPSAYLQQVYDMTRILEIERNDLYREVDELKKQLHLDYDNQCADLQLEREQIQQEKEQIYTQKEQLKYIFDTQLDQINDRQAVVDKLIADNVKLINELKENEILQNQQIQDYEDQIESLEVVNHQQKLILKQFKDTAKSKLISIQQQIQQLPSIEIQQFNLSQFIHQIKNKYSTHIAQLRNDYQNQIQELTQQNTEMNEEFVELKNDYGSLIKVLQQVRQSEDQLVEENEQLIQQINHQIAQIKQLEAKLQSQDNQNEDQQIEQLREEKIELQYDLEQKDLQVKELQSQILHLNNQSYLQESKIDEELNQEINSLKLQIIRYQAEQTEYLLTIKQLKEQADVPKEVDAWKIEDDDIDPWGGQSKQDDYLKLLEEHNELKEEYGSLSKVIQQIRRSEDQLMEENNHLEINNRALNQTIEKQTKTIFDYEETIAYLRLERNQMFEDIQSHERIKKDLQQEIDELTMKYVQLQKQLDANAQEYSNLINRYNLIQTEYDDINQKSSQYHKLNKELRKTEDGLIIENRELLQLIQEQQNELDYLRSFNKNSVQEVLAINELRQIELKQEPVQKDANAWDFEQSLEVEEQSDNDQQRLLEDHYDQIEDDENQVDDEYQNLDNKLQQECDDVCQYDHESEEQILYQETQAIDTQLQCEVSIPEKIVDPLFLENVISEEWQQQIDVNEQQPNTPGKTNNVPYFASEEKSQYQEDQVHSDGSVHSEFESQENAGQQQQLESVDQSDYPTLEQLMIKKKDLNMDPIEESECQNNEESQNNQYALESQVIESIVFESKQIKQSEDQVDVKPINNNEVHFENEDSYLSSQQEQLENLQQKDEENLRQIEQGQSNHAIQEEEDAVFKQTVNDQQSSQCQTQSEEFVQDFEQPRLPLNVTDSNEMQEKQQEPIQDIQNENEQIQNQPEVQELDNQDGIQIQVQKQEFDSLQLQEEITKLNPTENRQKKDNDGSIQVQCDSEINNEPEKSQDSIIDDIEPWGEYTVNEQPQQQQNQQQDQLDKDQEQFDVTENKQNEDTHHPIQVQCDPEINNQPEKSEDSFIEDIEPWGEHTVDHLPQQLQQNQQQNQDHQQPPIEEPDIDDLEDIDPWGNI